MKLQSIIVFGALYIGVASNFSPLLAQTGASCDGVLVKQIDNVSIRDRKTLSWLKIINENNYSEAKKAAEGSLLSASGWFSAGYEQFSAKRSAYFSENSGSYGTAYDYEEFKSYLTPEQTAAWLKCKGAAAEIETTYKNVDAHGATVVVSWAAGDLVGKLKNSQVRIYDGDEFKRRIKLGNFSGEKSFVLTRSDSNSALRGTIDGIAGENRKAFQSTFYLPPFVEPVAQDKPPLKVVTKLDGQVLTSVALWGSGTWKKEFQCISGDADNDLIIVDGTKDVGLGKHKGKCVGPGSYCDSFHEYCVDVVIQHGCLVSRKWHEWYKAQLALLSEPYNRSNICDPNYVVGPA